jgi:adenylate kinase
MAPITDHTVDALKDLVSKLEARVDQLETRLQKVDGSAPSSSRSNKELRMVLMGPPGAGMNSMAKHSSFANVLPQGRVLKPRK